MTEAARKFVVLVVGLLPFAVATAQTPTARERVAPEGPYRSQVRMLDDPAAVGRDDPVPADAEDDYGRALILKQRAMASIATGDHAAAIDALETALALESLAPLANAQMQANLGQLYIAAGRPAAASAALRAAIDGGVNDAAIKIALAGADLEQRNYAGAAAAALAAIETRGDAPADWLRIAVYALARDGRPEPAARWQARLLNRDPHDPQHWLQLAQLYAQAGNSGRAAATLSVAAAGGIALTEQQRLQAVSWLAASGAPDVAAQHLEELIAQRPELQYWQWLARLRLDARDEPGALDALHRVATLSDEDDDWLAAGELGLAIGDNTRALEALHRASAPRRRGAVRARALLLLGQTYAANGRIDAARRILLQASEYGGTAYRDATRWLDELGQPPAPTGAADTELVPIPAAAGELSVASAERLASPAVTTKTVPSLRVYRTAEQTRAARLVEDAAVLVRELLRTSRRERLEWTGPLHLVLTGNIADPEATIQIEVAAPIRRATPARGRFRSGELDTFHCAWRRYRGPWHGLDAAWREFYRDLVAAGYQPAAEARQVIFHRGAGDDDSTVELQIGIL